jgi:hypothetical protein
MPAEDTKAVYRHIDRIDATTGAVTLGRPFEAVRVGVNLVRAGLALDEFEARMTVRCLSDGTPVTPLAAPLYIQITALRLRESDEEDASVAGHIADLAALRATIGDPAAKGVTPEMQAETHMYDAHLNAPLDTVLPQRVVDAWTDDDIPAKPTIDPVIRKIQEETRVDEGSWQRVIDLPQHRVSQMRAMAREMLRPVLGNSAQLEDLRVLPMGHSEVERANAMRGWIKGADDIREMPPFTTQSMPGYKTSDALLADRDGVTLLMFSDMGGTYVYAWQSDPENAPKIRAEPEERPFPYNMLP